MKNERDETCKEMCCIQQRVSKLGSNCKTLLETRFAILILKEKFKYGNRKKKKNKQKKQKKQKKQRKNKSFMTQDLKYEEASCTKFNEYIKSIVNLQM